VNVSTGMMQTERGIRDEEVARADIHASLNLEFEHDKETGRTVLAASHQEPPLRVVRAFALPDGAALVHLHNVSGGLLGGDQLALHVRVGSRARAQLTTTGATRIYQPREGAPATTQVNEITVDENALLEFLPDSIIPFAGARFSQRTQIHLQEGAGIFWWEILAPGREARGEIFEYESLGMSVDITSMGRPIAAERIQLAPRTQALDSLARLGLYKTWATFYICRVGLRASEWIALEQELREIARGLSLGNETRWGISTLVRDGLIVRGLAVHGREALHGLHAFWSAAKMRLYQLEAVPPRKVN